MIANTSQIVFLNWFHKISTLATISTLPKAPLNLFLLWTSPYEKKTVRKKKQKWIDYFLKDKIQLYSNWLQSTAMNYLFI